jgi:hypothetical protein
MLSLQQTLKEDGRLRLKNLKTLSGLGNGKKKGKILFPMNTLIQNPFPSHTVMKNFKMHAILS